MDLVARIKGTQIEGYSEDVFKSVLERTHPSVRVKTVGNGILLLTDNTLIRCVHSYYRSPNPDTELKKFKNANAYCHYVQKAFNIEMAGINQCQQCHLECLSKKQDGALSRKYK